MNNYKILISFVLLVSSFVGFSQTYTTGTVILSSTSDLKLGVKIDITLTEVTLTYFGPIDRWFAIGFGGTGMDNTTDGFLFNNTTVFDRRIVPYDVPLIDANQDWTIISNNITEGKRKIIATRPLDTGEMDDYVFTHSDASIPVIWARGNGATYNLFYHGSNNRGVTSLSLTTLGLENNNVVTFAMYPNPTKKLLNIVLPSNIENIELEIYTISGNKILIKTLTKTFNNIDVSNLSSGIYLIKLLNSNGSFGIKQFVKD